MKEVDTVVQLRSSQLEPMQSVTLTQAFQHASHHLDHGDLQQAVYVAEQVLEQCPEFAPLLWLKAYCWETLGMPLDQRLAFVEQALHRGILGQRQHCDR